jgi:hypothetical protein
VSHFLKEMPGVYVERTWTPSQIPRKGCADSFIDNLIKHKNIIKKHLTFSPDCEKIEYQSPNPIGDKLPEFKVQREYTNWEEITVEADTKEEALALAEDDDILWEYAKDVSTYNYTGEHWVGEADE